MTKQKCTYVQIQLLGIAWLAYDLWQMVIGEASVNYENLEGEVSCYDSE